MQTMNRVQEVRTKGFSANVSQGEGIKVKKQVVTPDIAKIWLSKNKTNRRMSEKNVNFLAGQMKQKGAWKETGDPIKFNSDGDLIDGQHRLEALIRANVTLTLHVAENLEKSAFNVLDTGKNRSATDVVSTLGTKYTTAVTGAARSILLLQHGAMGSGGDQNKISRTVVITNAKVYDFVKKNQEELEESAHEMFGVYSRFGHIGHTTLTTMHFLIASTNRTKAEKFFEGYSTGIELTKESPIRVLREKLMKDILNKTKLKLKDKFALLIMAWNAYVKNKETDLRLKLHYEFPKLV